MIDPFFKYILDEMKPLRDTVLDIDDKIIMHKDLAIVFTRDKGKFYRKYDAQRQEGECTGYIAVNANSTGVVQKQIAASNSTPALGGGQINSNGTTGAEQPSTEASNNQTDGQNSQNNDSILGKRKA